VALALWLCLTPAMFGAESFAVFTGRDGGTSDLYRVDLGSLQIVRLTRSPANEMEAAVSPDGRRIVFVSDQGGAPALYLMDAAPEAQWTRLTTGAGAYAHPTFTPDGTRVTARYGPDPAHPRRQTQLVSITIADGTRTVLVDSAAAFPNGTDDDLLTVIDHPAWLDADRLVFAAAEYSGGDEAPRLTSSAIWRFAPSTGRLTHLVGGESAFDARGRARGVKATMPHREGARVGFVGIQGAVDRVPMVTSRTGTNTTVVALRDADFVGPCLAVGQQFLYVIDDGAGNWKLALKGTGEKTRRVVSFFGDASEPALIPERGR